MTHQLLEDHVIIRKNSKAVVKKGEKLLLIALHDTVAIVEDRRGEKFSVNVKIIDQIKLPK